MQIEGSVAIVTGCTGGLGKYICRTLAEHGARVAGVYQHSKVQAEKLALEWSGLGQSCIVLQADLTQPEQIRRMVDQVRDAYGRIDILVNNAATSQVIPFADLDGLTIEVWDRILFANLTSPFLCSKEIAPIMRSQGCGRIVNVVSNAGLAPRGSSIAYAVSKAGLIHLTRCLAVALGPEVAVNAVAPGTMLGTRMTARWDPAQIERNVNNAALRKPVDCVDVARQILEFCRSDSITGQVLILDSGLVFH